MQDLLIATCRSQPNLWFDDEALPEAFAAHGMKVVPTPWQDIAPGETPVLIRTPWDYSEHAADFVAWLEALAHAGTPIVNPADRMLWNLDKSYLFELQEHGVAIVPTWKLPAFDVEAVRQLIPSDTAAVVAKPIVGCAATGLVVVDRDTVREFDVSGNTWAPESALRPTGPCLVQPFLPQIEDAGEWSLFYFGGSFSHAILKHPKAGDIRVQEEHGGTTAAAEPPTHIREAAGQAVACVPDCTYVRVDGVDVDGAFLLMELELIEPELYFRYAPDAVPRFAAAVATVMGPPKTPLIK